MITRCVLNHFNDLWVFNYSMPIYICLIVHKKKTRHLISFASIYLLIIFVRWHWYKTINISFRLHLHVEISCFVWIAHFAVFYISRSLQQITFNYSPQFQSHISTITSFLNVTRTHPCLQWTRIKHICIYFFLSWYIKYSGKLVMTSNKILPK